MKKVILACILVLSLFPVIIHGETDVDLAVNAQSAILIEASSKQIIYRKNETERLHPASMTKLMGMLIVEERIQNGTLHWEDVITVSSHASSMGGSQIFLQENETMTLKELFMAICISSANDAMVAVAEHIGGTEEGFVQLMNEKAAQLGMENTHFSNATGLDIDNHYSCAYDMAILAAAVLDVSDESITEYTSTYEAYLREDTDPFWLVNTNKMIRTYEGMDGMKTGFTSTAGYCLTASAKRDGLRFIAVVMKEPTKDMRNADIKSMLDYGFSHYQRQLVYGQGTPLQTVYIANGKPDEAVLVCEEDIYAIVENGTSVEDQSQIIISNIKQSAPLSQHEYAATIHIDFGNGFYYDGYLRPQRDVYALDYMDIVLRTICAVLL